MGLIVYNNKARQATSTAYANITDGANLETANLSPKALLAVNSDCTITFTFSEPITAQAVCLLGVRVLADYSGLDAFQNVQTFEGTITIELDLGAGYTTISPDDYTMYRVRQTPFGDEHIVIVFDAEQNPIDGVRMTVSTDTPVNFDRYAGSFFIGDVIDDKAVASKASGIQPADSATRTATFGGQIYTSAGAAYRTIEISHGNLDEYKLFGGFSTPEELDASVTINSGFTDLGGGVYELTTAGGSAQLTFGNIIEDPDALFRFEYDASVDTSGLCALSSYIEDQMPFGLTFTQGEFDVGGGSTALLVSVNADTGQKIKLQGFRCYKQSGIEANRQWGRGGLSHFIANTGTRKPCLVILDATNHGAGRTGFYGIPSAYQRYQGVGGDLFTGGFTMDELL